MVEGPAAECCVRWSVIKSYWSPQYVEPNLVVAVQVELTASDWDECGMWLTALKRLIKIRQTMG